MSNQLRILAIEDEPEVLILIERTLSRDGFIVKPARNGRDGLNSIDTFKPDLILLDIMMPDMDGFDVIVALKQNIQTQNIPIFMLTAKRLMSDVEKAYDLGAENYITKPFDIKTLGEQIRNKYKNVSKGDRK